MKFKVLLTILALFVTTANAADGKYTLAYQQQNKWVAKQDIQPLRNAIEFYKKSPMQIKAVCSNKDKFCKKRVDIINLILKKQGVKQSISTIEKSSDITSNKIILENISLDKNKYSSIFINYNANQLKPITSSQKNVNSLLKYADLKYLSKFKMYCQKIDDTCNNRFKELSQQLAKNLSFKYNFALYESSNLTKDQAQLVAHRHNYSFTKTVNTSKPVTVEKTNKIIEEKPKKAKKDYSVIYSKDKNVVVFKENSASLELLERVKIEKLIENSKNNTFKFACGNTTKQLCQDRVHAIKNYALKNTNNIIIMEEFKHKIYRDYVLIIDKE